MWNPVGSDILSSELPDSETFTMRLETWLSSGCAPRAASTKARTQSQTWSCCENVLVTWAPKNMLKDLNLNNFCSCLKEVSGLSISVKSSPKKITQPKGGTCPGVPNHCGKAAAWSLDLFTQRSKGLKVAYKRIAQWILFPTYRFVLSGDIIRAYFEWFCFFFWVVEFVDEQSFYSAKAPLPGSECQWHEGIEWTSLHARWQSHRISVHSHSIWSHDRLGGSY